MPKLQNCYEWSDLLFVAQDLGYGWNEAHRILVDSGNVPGPEYNAKMYLERADLEEESNPDARIILTAFLEKEGINWAQFVP